MATTRHTRKGKTRRHVHQTNNGSLTKVKIRGKKKYKEEYCFE